MTHESTERNILSVHNEFILFKVEADNFPVPLAFQSGIIVGTAFFFFFAKTTRLLFQIAFHFYSLVTATNNTGRAVGLFNHWAA